MLKRWCIENFKAFSGRVQLDLAPITLLCGPNSTGKSTILQSMLMIKQTLQYAPPTRPIALNGPLIRLGTFADVINNNAAQTDSEIHISWCVNAKDHKILGDSTQSSFYQVDYDNLEDIQISLTFSPSGKKTDSDYLQLYPSLTRSNLSVTVATTSADGEKSSGTLHLSFRRPARARTRLKLDTTEPSIGQATHPFIISDIDASSKAEANRRPGSRILGCYSKHFLLDYILVRYNRALLNADSVARIIYSGGAAPSSLAASRLVVPAHFFEKLTEWLGPKFADVFSSFRSREHPVTVRELRDKIRTLSVNSRRELSDTLGPYHADLVRYLSNAYGPDEPTLRVRLDELETAASFQYALFKFAMSYLGPLRDPPKPLYPLQPLGGPSDVGIQGEHAAAVLNLHERQTISYVPSTAFRDGRPTSEMAVSATLKAAVIDWLDYLGVASDIETSDLGKVGHSIQVKTPNHESFHDLTNVGVGVSQVLPIVVQCLLADSGSVLIFEQPELHLHPAVQARLADFFISVALLGKQCIIETHGEHLVDRVRYRIVEAEADDFLDLSRIYFFEQISGRHSCRLVPVSSYGAINDWPEDFFDQSRKEKERIVLAAAKKRRLQMEKNTKNK